MKTEFYITHPNKAEQNMITYKRVSTIQKYLKLEKRRKKSIGLIPTMGALHEGHLSLIKRSQEENDVTVVSIFVNPTQFNQKEDLIKYPRDLKKDQLLIKDHCDYLFAPSVSQMYPDGEGKTVKLDISHLTDNMEGPNRPGHFEGVVQVVHRLLEIIKPDKLYMGQKDFQQFSIIQYMLSKLKMKTTLVVCPIIREKDGLAMSSRNRRLKPSIRKKANLIFDSLLYAKEHLVKLKPGTIEKRVLAKMNIKNFELEYFNIVDAYSLEPVIDSTKHNIIVACTAVWAGDVRLIDNMILKGQDRFYKGKI